VLQKRGLEKLNQTSNPVKSTGDTVSDKSPDDNVSISDESGQKTAPGREIGGVKGPEPTRFGDWEKNGRCIDF
jgi:hypothetical protein